MHKSMLTTTGKNDNSFRYSLEVLVCHKKLKHHFYRFYTQRNILFRTNYMNLNEEIHKKYEHMRISWHLLILILIHLCNKTRGKE